MPPAISVIIPAHNEEQYIRKTLFSLEQQTFQNFEAIVVANGCTDATEDILKRRHTLKHYSLPVANVSRARNTGAAHALGDILVFLDADTSLQKDSLQKIQKQFTPQCSVGTTYSVPDSAQLRYKVALACKNTYHRLGLYHGCSGVLLCRAAAFHAVGGYPDIAVREHRKLILKLRKEGKFKCVDTYVITSMRRFKKWGLAKAFLFWMRQWVKDKAGRLGTTEYEKIR